MTILYSNHIFRLNIALRVLEFDLNLQKQNSFIERIEGLIPEKMKMKNEMKLIISGSILSIIHREIYSCLKSMDEKVELEHQVEDVFKVDILLPDLPIVIEVNGQGHYAPENHSILNSMSCLRMGLLNEMGIFSLIISSETWNNLKGITRKNKYLETLIQKSKRASSLEL